ncbi:MAG: hypothetical protein M3Z64_06460 [Verrucomicrobiota bacterium]|nr:hypothetical protein [Verrucomicrobiota bacterium]
MTRSTTFAAVLLAGLMATASAAAPATSPSEQQAVLLIKEIQTQQAAITENQAKIDAKIATIAEAIRQARIFASRGR